MQTLQRGVMYSPSVPSEHCTPPVEWTVEWVWASRSPASPSSPVSHGDLGRSGAAALPRLESETGPFSASMQGGLGGGERGRGWERVSLLLYPLPPLLRSQWPGMGWVRLHLALSFQSKKPKSHPSSLRVKVRVTEGGVDLSLLA